MKKTKRLLGLLLLLPLLCYAANNYNILDQGSGGSSSPRVISAPNNASTLGDSIIYYGITGLNGTYSNSHVGWFNDLMHAGGRTGVEVTKVYAAPGAALEDVIGNQLPLALADDNKIAWLHAGINNLNTTLGNNDPVPTMMTAYQTIIGSLSAAKRLVIVDSINPVLQSGSTGAKNRAATIPTVNAALKQLCQQYPNVIYNDTYSAMIDPTSNALNPLANMVRSDDGIHFLSQGAKTAGYATFANISQNLGLTAYRTPGTNVLPTFSGTGGTVTAGGFITVTGTPPVGWELLGVSGASATQSVTFSTLAPNYIRMTFANTGGAAGTTYLRVSNLQASFAAGDVVQGAFGFQATGMTSFNRIAIALRRNGVDVWNGMGTDSTNEPSLVYPQISQGGYRTTTPWTLPAGAITNFEFIIAINLGPTNGAGVIDIYTPALYKLN